MPSAEPKFDQVPLSGLFDFDRRWWGCRWCGKNEREKSPQAAREAAIEHLAERHQLTVQAEAVDVAAERPREMLRLLLAANAPGQIWDHYVRALLAGEDIDPSEIRAHVAADRAAWGG